MRDLAVTMILEVQLFLTLVINFNQESKFAMDIVNSNYLFALTLFFNSDNLQIEF